jgi:Trk K+ transport system NAD-binding subunit
MDQQPTPGPRRQNKAAGRRNRMNEQSSGTPAKRSATSTHGAEDATILQRVRYRFDLALARGPMVIVGWLGGLTALIILIGAIAAWATNSWKDGDGRPDGFFESIWQSLLRVIDAGTFAGDSGNWARFIALLVTLAGIFIAGSLIGLIATAVDQKIQDMRKGRSLVLEHGHTLVLGWSPRLPVILSELVEANSNHKHAAVVVLADMDKTEMEDLLNDKVRDLRTTRVVCRSGQPADRDDLEMVNVAGARSIIVLSGEDGDAGAVKAVLAVKSLDPDFERAHVVVEFEDPANALTLRTVTDGRVLTVSSDAIIAEVTAQACHQSGLSSVYRELLDFDGDEIYFETVPELVGRTYGDAVLAFEESSVMGLHRADDVVELNPPAATVLGDGDRLIVISEDDDTVVFGGVTEAVPPAPSLAAMPDERPERILVVGWSSLGPMVVKELDEFMASGTTFDIVVDTAYVDPTTLTDLGLANSTTRVHPTKAGPEALLALADVDPFDQVIVLGYREHLGVSEADARTLLTLLTLRKAFQGHEGGGVRIVAEVLDRADVSIAVTAGVDDFIVSDELASLMIAQLSENAELMPVFDELFDATGAYLVLRPAGLYCGADAVTVAQLRAAALQRGESALGYRVAETGEVVVNPNRSDSVRLVDGDQVLVLASKG